MKKNFKELNPKLKKLHPNREDQYGFNKGPSQTQAFLRSLKALPGGPTILKQNFPFLGH
jgi:hypothetical protein